MSATPSCPYCNAVVAVPAGTRAGQLVPCPRCGERFPYHGPTLNGTAPAPQPAPAAPAAVRQPLVDRLGEGMRGWSRRSVVLLILGVMAVMAVTGLTFALLTTAYRRSNDFPRPADDRAAAVRVVAPADLAALGYLPPNTDVVVGVHVAEALQEPAGQDFLRRFLSAGPDDRRQDQGRGPTTSLEQWTGLSPDEIDHAVLGLNVADQAIPRLVLVVQTRRRYDPEKVRTALRAARGPDQGGKKLFRFHGERPPVDAVLWFAGERTLVVGLTAEDLERVPDSPPPGSAHLAAPLQEMLRTRLTPGSQAWAVGHADDWDRTTARLVLATLGKEDRKTLEGVRTFGAWLQFGQGLTLNGAFHCGDDSKAEALEKYLTPADGGESKAFRLLPGRAENGPTARELGRTLKVVRDGAWVMLQAKAKPPEK